jgi:hypothetical protein
MQHPFDAGWFGGSQSKVPTAVGSDHVMPPSPDRNAKRDCGTGSPDGRVRRKSTSSIVATIKTAVDPE